MVLQSATYQGGGSGEENMVGGAPCQMGAERERGGYVGCAPTLLAEPVALRSLN